MYYVRKLHDRLRDSEHGISLRVISFTYYHRVLDRQTDAKTHRLELWHAVAYEHTKTQSVLRLLSYLSNTNGKRLPLWNWKWKLEAWNCGRLLNVLRR